jgi:hypothetical protein
MAPQLPESPGKVRFHSRQGRSRFSLLFFQAPKHLVHGLLEHTQVGASDGVAGRNQDFSPTFDQDAFIHGRKALLPLSGHPRENSRNQRSSEIHVPGQETEMAIFSLGNDFLDRFIEEHMAWKKNLELQDVLASSTLPIM